MICEMCNYTAEPAEFVDVFGGLIVCADFGGCVNRQAAAQPQNYEIAVLAQDRTAYDKKRKEAQQNGQRVSNL